MSPLQNMITWYKIFRTGWQIGHWDIQNKENLSLSELSCIVLNVPGGNLPSSMITFVPCDRIPQRDYMTCWHTFVKNIVNITLLVSTVKLVNSIKDIQCSEIIKCSIQTNIHSIGVREKICSHHYTIPSPWELFNSVQSF